jgi:ubiquinol-cytochrome c reductase subunit 6
MLSLLFSSLTVHADAPEEKEEKSEQVDGLNEAAEAEEEEAEEPEDVCLLVSWHIGFKLTTVLGVPLQLYPAIREQCQESKACAGSAKHFAHCQVKISDLSCKILLTS